MSWACSAPIADKSNVFVSAVAIVTDLRPVSLMQSEPSRSVVPSSCQPPFPPPSSEDTNRTQWLMWRTVRCGAAPLVGHGEMTLAVRPAHWLKPVAPTNRGERTSAEQRADKRSYWLSESLERTNSNQPLRPQAPKLDYTTQKAQPLAGDQRLERS
ncbi:unnamed protein product [Pleuronectes platessa]|uniref:Uncharacterized protein n=1 Tax=Pleuronectes platessa TaxID=8262 RepID=A0A9N7UV88_PLEPL|nr:unnamed protein product [Pleuronectes platessa]